MKKIAWPWIGSTEHEMGSMSDAFKDIDQSAYTNYDSLTPEKSTAEVNGPSINYSESRVSPVDGDGETISLADDEEVEEETIVSVLDKNKKVAKFKCYTAKTFQEKVNGLQVYSSLNNDEGLIFEYESPQDVLYHMGTVKFPIDIIFLNKDNEIQKICNNIQPGTLGTFGCANVLNVLEVVGGTAESLGLKPGDKVEITKQKSTFSKTAQSVKQYNPKLIYVYNFDGLISKNPYIKISKAQKYDEENIVLKSDGSVFTPGESFIIKSSELDQYPNHFFSKTSSGLKEFLENSTDTYEIHTDLKENLKNPNSIVIFTTAMESPKSVVNAFLSKLEVLYGSFKRKDVVVYKIAQDYNHLNIIEDFRRLYPYSEVRLFADDELTKKAGVPIPSHVREKAKEVIKSLDLAEKIIKKSVDAIKQNLNEYEKIRDREDKIKETQGQYHQSTKRNVEIAKQYLLSIRDAIKVLNQIKDATTTIDIIEALAEAAHIASESIQEIFNLINKMNTPDFVMLLTEATRNYEKAAEDLEFTLERAREYINTHILGIIVLST